MMIGEGSTCLLQGLVAGVAGKRHRALYGPTAILHLAISWPEVQNELSPKYAAPKH